MLSCENLSVRAPGSDKTILSNASVYFQPHSLNAVIGPSGCGKTTLMKALLGIMPSEGSVYYNGQSVSSSEDLIGRVGFAPQFTLAHERLTVEESIYYSLELYVKDAAVRLKRIQDILQVTGLEALKDTRVSSLSGGQRRRLGLGLELVNDPELLVCDEVTSGLDPRSEDEILELLKHLCQLKKKTFVNIIHNLAKLHFFDSITVVYSGDVVFQGTLKELHYYFDLDDVLKLYDQLNSQPLEHWQKRWKQYSEGMTYNHKSVEPVSLSEQPGPVSQTLTLCKRRFSLFFRDKGYLLLTLGMTLGFPCVVILFALDGLPQIESLIFEHDELGFLEKLKAQMDFQMEAAQTAQLVSGLVMFQVVLLTLMGLNNGSKEIVSNRELYEKERLNGLQVGAYVISRLTFISFPAILQGIAMTLIVKYVCNFPGPLLPQIILLSACAISMSWVCLGLSAICKTTEKAWLLSVCLVGFQLPLSGIFLALPDALVWVFRPFINAYWAWAGTVTSMVDSRIYDAFTLSDPTFRDIPVGAAILVLALHALVGAGMAFWGCQRKSWN